MKSALPFFCLFLFGFVLKAQISQPGRLRAEIIMMHQDLKAGRTALKTISLKPIDNAAEIKRAQEIAAQCVTCKRDFYGVGIDASIDVKGQGFTALDNGRLWRTTIESPGAFALQFFFNHYKVPEGAELYLRNEDGSMTLGSFGNSNNHEDGKFATQTIAGDRITIYYFEPYDSKFSGDLRIGKVIHAFKSVYKSGEFGSSESCEIDINCPEGSSYQDVKRAVARISYYDNSLNLSAHCSGALINTTSNSKKPYLLTANHCVTAPAGYENSPRFRYWQWIFEFNYETLLCNGTVEPMAQSVQGATLLSKGTLSDYALLNISTVPNNYNVLYLGWDTRNNVTPTKTIGIHHPNGDVKKISIDNEAPVLVKTQTNGDMFDEVAGLPKTDIKVHWNSGITEGGSSGSPLISQDKRVIGQLRGGKSACTVTEPDYYGRLAVSIDNPDATFPTLKSLIDDNNTGATNWASNDSAVPGNGTFKVNSIEITSNRWEEVPKLFGRITYDGNVQDLTYQWAPAEDFVDANAAVGVLNFGGQKPILPLTKQYSLIVTTPGGLVGNQVVTVTIYDCENKDIYLDLCSLNNSEIGFIGGANETYQWSPATYLSDVTVSNPVFSPPGTGAFDYTLVATTGNCTRTENYHLTIVGIPELPSFAPTRTGEKAIAGIAVTYSPKTIKTSDGNLLVISNFLIPGTGFYGTRATKMDPNFNTIWAKDALGIPCVNMVEVPDGYVILGSNHRTAGGGSGYALAKIDFSGNPVWTKYYYPATTQEALGPIDIFSLDNGDVVVLGDRTYYNVAEEAFIARVNPAGSLVYSKKIIVSMNNSIVRYWMNTSTMKNNDEIYVITGQFFITVYTSNGSIKSVRSHTFSPPRGDGSYLSPIQRMTLGHDGTILGTSREGRTPTGNFDVRLIKFDENTNLLWKKYYGGSGLEEEPTSLIGTSDGGYLMGLSSSSPADGTKSQNAWNASNDYWIFKIDENGNELGDVRYGGNAYDMLTDITDIGWGNYVITGGSRSGVTGDRTLPLSSSDGDIWLLKITDTGSPSTNPTPQRLDVCTSSGADFNNLANPYRNELVFVGGCASTVNFENGSKTSVRASQQLIIKANTHIKAGSEFYARIGSVNLSPCDVNSMMNGSLITETIVAESVNLTVVESDSPKESSATQLTFYPNPSDGTMTMKADLLERSTIYLVIYDALGTIVFSKTFFDVFSFQEELALDELKNGVYSVHARLSGTIVKDKIIIMK